MMVGYAALCLPLFRWFVIRELHQRNLVRLSRSRNIIGTGLHPICNSSFTPDVHFHGNENNVIKNDFDVLVICFVRMKVLIVVLLSAAAVSLAFTTDSSNVVKRKK